MVRDRSSLRRTAVAQAVLAAVLIAAAALVLAGVFGHRSTTGIGLMLLACFDAGMASVNWLRSRRAPAGPDQGAGAG